MKFYTTFKKILCSGIMAATLVSNALAANPMSSTLTIKVLPNLTASTQGHMHMPSTITVSFDDDNKLFTVLGEDGNVQSIKVIDESSFELIKNNWEEIYESVLGVVSSHQNSALDIYTIDGEVTEEFTDSLVETLAEKLGLGIDVSQSVVDLIPSLRDDFINIEAQVNYGVIAGVDVMSAQDLISDALSILGENSKTYVQGKAGVTHNEDVTVYWEEDEYFFEEGNEKSGEQQVKSRHVYEDGSPDLTYTETFDYDTDNDGIEDTQEKDGRGDGDGFIDWVNDALKGDDGDGITAESEAGRMYLTNHVLDFLNEHVNRITHSNPIIRINSVKILNVH